MDSCPSMFATSAHYVYNSHGERVRKVTERQSNDAPAKLKDTIYLGSSDIYRTFHGDGSIVKDEKLTSYIADGSADPVAVIETSNQPDSSALIRYSLNHGLEVDDQARIVSYEEYSPFGSSTVLICGKDIEAPSRYRFASYVRDTETGLYYCSARYYCSWLGRWLSADPIGIKGGLNLFAYVGNDPINHLDAAGTIPGHVQNNQVEINTNPELNLTEKEKEELREIYEVKKEETDKISEEYQQKIDELSSDGSLFWKYVGKALNCQPVSTLLGGSIGLAASSAIKQYAPGLAAWEDKHNIITASVTTGTIVALWGATSGYNMYQKWKKDKARAEKKAAQEQAQTAQQDSPTDLNASRAQNLNDSRSQMLNHSIVNERANASNPVQQKKEQDIKVPMSKKGKVGMKKKLILRTAEHAAPTEEVAASPSPNPRKRPGIIEAHIKFGVNPERYNNVKGSKIPNVQNGRGKSLGY